MVKLVALCATRLSWERGETRDASRDSPELGRGETRRTSRYWRRAWMQPDTYVGFISSTIIKKMTNIGLRRSKIEIFPTNKFLIFFSDFLKIFIEKQKTTVFELFTHLSDATYRFF